MVNGAEVEIDLGSNTHGTDPVLVLNVHDSRTDSLHAGSVSIARSDFMKVK